MSGTANLPSLPNAGTLDGTEPIETFRGGASAKTTTLAIANLGGGIQKVSIELTAEQIISLHSVPVEVIAAPGAGKFIVPFAWVINLDAGTIHFDAAAGQDLKFVINSVNMMTLLGSSNTIASAVDAVGIQSGANSLFSFPYPTEATFDNKPLLLTTAGSDFNAGVILTSSLNAGGSGYAPGDEGLVEDAELATYEVDTVSGGGAVLTYHITDPGDSYVPATGAATTATSGAGTGFTINILTTTLGNGTVTATIFYAIVP